MLVLSRRQNESILLGGEIRVVIISVRNGQVRLGIEAPDRVGIIREELVLQARDAAAVARPHPG